MLVASFNTIIGIPRVGSVYMPYNRYVMSPNQFQNVAKHAVDDGFKVVSQSSFNPYLRPYAGNDLNGKRFLINRHTAFGDQLIMTGIIRFLRKKFPQAELLYFAEGMMVSIWLHNPDMMFCGTPIPFETARACDYHVFLRGMFENDTEPDQENCYDSFYRYLGFNAEEIDPIYKRPWLFLSEEDERAIRVDKEKMGNYILYQWQASNPNRTYPEEQSIATLQLLSDALPDHKFVVVGQCQRSPDLQHIPRVVNAINQTPDFRRVIHLTKGADAVICPDSSVGHVVGAFPEIPCVSLWGLFAPNDRVKYYSNHYPLTGFHVCPHAPCHNHEFQLPESKCKEASNHISPAQYCNALRAIKPEEICQALLKKITKNSSPQSQPSLSESPTV